MALTLFALFSKGARLEQEVEVFCQWHALYGRRVRRQYSEQRALGEEGATGSGGSTCGPIGCFMAALEACKPINGLLGKLLEE